MQVKSHATEAEQFHEQVGDWLASLGYDLVDEPEIEHTRFRVSQATHRSTNDLYLQVVFNPVDGNAATISFGRLWRSEDGWSRLSNSYAIFAKRLGLEVPEYYELGYGADVAATVTRIWDDLQDTLPDIMSNTTSDLLANVEQDQYGAQRLAVGRYGPEFESHVEVSRFPRTE